MVITSVCIYVCDREVCYIIIVPREISYKFLHILHTEHALNLSLFLQGTCKNCSRNFTFYAQFLTSYKNLVRNLQGTRILQGKYPFLQCINNLGRYFSLGSIG